MEAKGTAGSIPLWGWEEVPSSHPMAQQCYFTGVFDAQGRRAINRLPRYYNYMHIAPSPCAKHAESQENDIQTVPAGSTNHHRSDQCYNKSSYDTASMGLKG